MLPLCRCWFAVVVGLLASSQLVAEDKPDSKEAPLEKAAKAFVALLGKGEFENATGDFDEAMLKALPADKLKGTLQLTNLNHLFQTCKTGAVTEYGAIEETMAAGALETITDWILKRTRVNGQSPSRKGRR